MIRYVVSVFVIISFESLFWYIFNFYIFVITIPWWLIFRKTYHIHGNVVVWSVKYTGLHNFFPVLIENFKMKVMQTKSIANYENKIKEVSIEFWGSFSLSFSLFDTFVHWSMICHFVQPPSLHSSWILHLRVHNLNL